MSNTKQLTRFTLLMWSVVLLAILQSVAQPSAGVPFVNYRLSGGTCQQLTYPGGSRVFVPQGSFVTAGGEAYLGEVLLQYREYHDVADMILGKIRMDINHGGRNGHLASAGMFELQASTPGGEVLQLGPGKKIRVRFSSLQPADSRYLAFRMEDAGWVPLGRTFTDLAVDQGQDDEDLWGGRPPVEGIGGDGFDQEGWMDDDWCDCEDGFGWASEQWSYTDSLRTEVFKEMEIDQMGLYNYDMYLEEMEQVPVYASFTVGGEALKQDVYVVYAGINSVFYYPSYQWDTGDFALYVRDDAQIFTILEDGTVAELMKPTLTSNTIAGWAGTTRSFALQKRPRLQASHEGLTALLSE